MTGRDWVIGWDTKCVTELQMAVNAWVAFAAKNISKIFSQTFYFSPIFLFMSMKKQPGLSGGRVVCKLYRAEYHSTLIVSSVNCVVLADRSTEVWPSELTISGGNIKHFYLSRWLSASQRFCRWLSSSWLLARVCLQLRRNYLLLVQMITCTVHSDTCDGMSVRSVLRSDYLSGLLRHGSVSGDPQPPP